MFAGFFRAARAPWIVRLAVAATGMSLLVSSCSSGAATPTGPAAPSSVNMSLPSPMPSSSSAATNDRDAAATAYTEFWSRLNQVPSEQESAWLPALSAVATDPQLTTTVQAIRFQAIAGNTIYGTVVTHITTVDLSGDQATVHDCQDASHTGQADAKTGKPKTVGVPKNPIIGTVVRGTDDAWKVSRITYPGGTCS